MNFRTPRRFAAAASVITLCACATGPEDDRIATPLADAEQAVEAAQGAIKDAEGAPDLGAEEIALLKESVFVAAAIPSDVPGDFTGCYADAEACFVGGNQVDAAVRYEPQSGRFWFLDPGSGNTYFANGELRTENGFRAALSKKPPAAPVLAMAAVPSSPSVKPEAAPAEGPALPPAPVPKPELAPKPDADAPAEDAPEGGGD